MAEKNTLSILETIKKKMHKLDQKTEKGGKISELRDEFEYIAPAKKQEEASKLFSPETSASQQAQNQPIFKDDLGFEDIRKPVAVVAQVTTSGDAGKSEEINLDDLDLDDESGKNKATQQVEVKENLESVAGEDFNEEDLENYEDEIDFAEEENSPIIQSAKQSVAEVEAVDPLAFTPEIDPLNFTPELPKTELDAKIDAKIDDLNLGNLAQPAIQEISQIDELNLDNLDNNKHEEDPLKLDDFEGVLEEKSQPALTEKHDELDLDNLDNFLAEEPKKEKKEDDLNFDDLELEEDEVVKKEQPKPAEIKAEVDPTDLELDKLELELQSKKSQIQQEEVAVKSASPAEEIDLEFEKEMMGLKPEAVKESPSQLPTYEAFESDSSKKVEQFLNEDDASKISQQQSLDVNPSKIEVMPSAQNFPQNMQNAESFEVRQERAGQIIHDSTMRQATDSIKKLIDAKNVVAGISSFSQSPALSELAVQLMEPKLERWLNDNLPEMVEKIVREEIKKIIPKE